MLFVIVGICRYVRSGRIPVTWIAGFLVAIVFAYVLIEPFRDVIRAGEGGNQRSFTQIAETMTFAQRESDMQRAGDAPTWVKVLARSSITADGSRGCLLYTSRCV